MRDDVGLPGEYVIEHATRALACDERTGVLDIAIEVEGDRIVARGQVPTEDRRAAIVAVLEEEFPHRRIACLVTVAPRPADAPPAEDIG